MHRDLIPVTASASPILLQIALSAQFTAQVLAASAACPLGVFQGTVW